MSSSSVHLFLVLGVFSLLAGLDLNLPMDIENVKNLRPISQEKLPGQLYNEVEKPVWCGLLVSHNLLRLQEVGSSSEQNISELI